MNSPLRPLALLIIFALLSLSSCQEIRDKRVALTIEQWKRVRKNITKQRPSPRFPVGARFGVDGVPAIELIGYDVHPNTLTPNGDFIITWYWAALADLEKDWSIFIHFVPQGGGEMQNLDHHPVEGLFRTSLWEKGTFITDVQRIKLKSDFPPGGGWLDVGFFRGDLRLELLSPGAGETLPGETNANKLRAGRIDTATEQRLIAYRAHADDVPKIDGELDDPIWSVAARSTPFVDPNTGQRASNKADVRAVYTHDALYLAFEVKDKDLRTPFTNRDDTLWKHDCVEIFINPEGDDGTYWELQIAPNEGPPIFDAFFETYKKPTWETAKNANIRQIQAGYSLDGTLNTPIDKKDLDRGYTVEVRIPFRGLTRAGGSKKAVTISDIPPLVGSTWRIQFYHVDDPGVVDAQGRTRNQYGAWTHSTGDFHNLSRFGTLEFGPERRAPASAKKPQKRPEKKPEKKTSPLTIRKGFKGARITALPERFRLDANTPFLHCVRNLKETGDFRSHFTITVDESGAVAEVERDKPFISERVDGCVTRGLKRWKVTVREPIPNRPPNKNDLLFRLTFLYKTPPPAPERAPKPTGAVTPKPTGAVTPKPTGAVTPKPTGAVTPKPTGAVTPKPTGAVTPKPTGAVTPKPTGAVTPKPSPTPRGVPAKEETPPPARGQGQTTP